jgi:tRNA-splicing ligase RtcB
VENKKIKSDHVTAKLWIPEEEIEESAVKQLTNICALPWAVHVAVMPDVHYGKGATVGSVIGLKGAISPAAVGVDIGCGMMAVKTNLTASDLPDSLKEIRHQIERDIPVGFNHHKSTNIPEYAFGLFAAYSCLSEKVQTQALRSKALLQCGTLGGGNHFIEICLDQNQKVWFMLHSGSRNIGKTLADIHIEKAKTLTHNADIIDPDLAVFLSNTIEFHSYLHDLHWAQHYAGLNRMMMMDILYRAVSKFYPGLQYDGASINCHHNYVVQMEVKGEELLVTRKGAISARAGEMGIIPGSMGAKSFIVKGLGNPDSLYSASHGAGRKMSRGKAKRAFTVEDMEKQTAGVECRKDEGVIDEIPGAYKDIDQVMAYQKDLVEVVAELKQVLCVKG